MNEWVKSGRCDTSACAEARLNDQDFEVQLRSNLRPAAVLDISADGWDVFREDILAGTFDSVLSARTQKDLEETR